MSADRFAPIRTSCSDVCGVRDVPPLPCDCGAQSFNAGIAAAEVHLAVIARDLAREIESLAAFCGYQRPAESSVCAFLDAAETMIAGRVERCSGCGMLRGEHAEYAGEPCYTRDTDRGPEPDRCGEWIGTG